ncbi:hypothetical protein pb186bvf_005969 [Paramecium bursaria]
MSKQAEQPKAIPLEQLTPEQLLQVKKQLEEEVQQLNSALSLNRMANTKYEESKAILQKLEKTPDHSEVLVPITTSLYVPGRFINPQQVTIDYGTGYYVERNTTQAFQLCDRKLGLLKEQYDKVVDVINQKKQFMDKINIELQRRVAKVQQIQQQQQVQKK